MRRSILTGSLMILLWACGGSGGSSQDVTETVPEDSVAQDLEGPPPDTEPDLPPVICAPGEVRCGEGGVETCKADGTAWDLTQACDPAEICLEDQGVCCLPDCFLKDCGPDGCGGSCGDCEPGWSCTDDGKCEELCFPDCGGKECGDDGCDGSCGDCPEGLGCVEDHCVSICTPDCAGKVCGDDGCGGSCGDCPEGLDCGHDGFSIACTKTCLDQADCQGLWEVPGNCIQGHCIPSECESDADCGEGPQHYCDPYQRCLLLIDCEASADCPIGADPITGRKIFRYCDEGWCRPGGNCAGDEDCPGEATCGDNWCSAAACDEESCPPNLPVCSYGGDCPAPPCNWCVAPCFFDADCGEGEHCEVGSCQPKPDLGCLLDTDCGEGEYCSTLGCKPLPLACEDETDCPEEGLWLCLVGWCVDTDPEPPVPCETQEDCVEFVCTGGFCKPPWTCLDDGACPEGTYCDKSECAIPPCGDDADCPEGQVCEFQAGGAACVDPPQCWYDVQCPPDHLCEDGLCYPTEGLCLWIPLEQPYCDDGAECTTDWCHPDAGCSHEKILSMDCLDIYSCEELEFLESQADQGLQSETEGMPCLTHEDCHLCLYLDQVDGGCPDYRWYHAEADVSLLLGLDLARHEGDCPVGSCAPPQSPPDPPCCVGGVCSYAGNCQANVDTCLSFFACGEVDSDGDGLGNGCDPDDDNDGFLDGDDCEPLDPQAFPDAPERCNFQDDDCDLEMDEDFPLLGGSCLVDDPEACEPVGYWICQDDVLYCQPLAWPGAIEICDGKDNDCDGETDEPGSQGCVACWADQDLDGFGEGLPQCICAPNPQACYDQLPGDCDDQDPDVYPQAPELCDEKDNDCNNLIDDGCE